MEADPPPGRVVVVEFESIDKARAFYHSPEYAVLKELRRSTSSGPLFLVDGVGG